jgi:membrane-bound lytic murein transglycosylase D
MSRVALLFAFLVCFGVSTAGATPPPLRFGADFPLSPAMEERVRFWIRVFTEWSQNDAVLHDRDDVRVVYEVVPYGARDGAVEPVRASYARLLASMAIGEIFPAALSRPVDIGFGLTSPERLRVGALFPSTQVARPLAFTRACGNIRVQRGQREIFADSLARAELYLPAIRRIFAAAHLPAELVYLPHVESSFNPNAVSRAGAAGLWQFTRDTGDRHLRIAGGVDERFDPVRSSAAAAEHLARARDVLGTWPLAVTSYNHGIGGIARARAAVGSDSLDDIIRGYTSTSFGFASRNFYAEFLAAAHVARHARYYFPELKRTPLLQYVVRPGDSLWKIARRHRVSVKALVAANNLGRSPLQQGQRLVIRL